MAKRLFFIILLIIPTAFTFICLILIIITFNEYSAWSESQILVNWPNLAPNHKTAPQEICRMTDRSRIIGSGCYTVDSDCTALVDDFNLDPPSTYLNYSHPKQGISFLIPYNNNWGNNHCFVRPYLEIREEGSTDPSAWPYGVVFGIPSAFEQVTLMVMPPRSVEYIKAEWMADYDNIIAHTKIAGLDCLIYNSLRESPIMNIEVISPGANYLFYTQASPNNPGDPHSIQRLKSVVESVRLTEY